MKAKIIKRISTLFKYEISQNLLTLYSAYVSNSLVIIMVMPYLAKIIGPFGWGVVASSTAYAGCIMLFIDYGFSLSATREVACQHNNPQRLSELLAGVLGAKLLFTIPVIVVSIILQRIVPLFREHPILLWTALLWAITKSFNFIWYYQGLKRMGLVAVLSIATDLLFLFGIFTFINKPEDTWKVLAVSAASCFISSTAGMIIAHREVGFIPPTFSSIQEVIKNGWNMSIFRGPVNLYTIGNPFILGLFAAPELVGYYSCAEKITRGFLAMLIPINSTLYPRLSHIAYNARAKQDGLIRASKIIMCSMGILLGSVIFLFAPVLIKILLGSGFEPAIPLLRLFAFLVPLTALSNFLGIHRMLPLRLDRPFRNIIVSATVLSLALVLTLAPRHLHLGVTWSVLIAEAFVVLSMYIYLKKRSMLI